MRKLTLKAMDERLWLHRFSGIKLPQRSICLKTAQTSARRAYAVFDLIEEFRGPLCEACALALFNRKAVTAEHFAQSGSGTSLTREGWRAVIRGYETWIARPIESPRSGRKVLWRQLLLEQARAYASACLDGGPYEPYRMDY